MRRVLSGYFWSVIRSRKLYLVGFGDGGAGQADERFPRCDGRICINRAFPSRIRFLCALLSDRAAAGDPAFLKMVEEGHLDHYRKEVDFLERHFDDWMRTNERS
ncbi:MAG: hypothetical protein C6W55_15270 [Thermobacillus sp.]|nr:MAG: hypothetical protein C6W59_07500 [Paenibacillaceae bacterium]REK52801.1 MAG: hypothetical protein C6W55_15270 [Thermobacillus sp.]